MNHTIIHHCLHPPESAEILMPSRHPQSISSTFRILDLKIKKYLLKSLIKLAAASLYFAG